MKISTKFEICLIIIFNVSFLLPLFIGQSLHNVAVRIISLSIIRFLYYKVQSMLLVRMVEERKSTKISDLGKKISIHRIKIETWIHKDRRGKLIPNIFTLNDWNNYISVFLWHALIYNKIWFIIWIDISKYCKRITYSEGFRHLMQ